MKNSHSDVEKIVDEAVKIYFDYGCTVAEAVEWAKEIMACSVNFVKG